MNQIIQRLKRLQKNWTGRRVIQQQPAQMSDCESECDLGFSCDQCDIPLCECCWIGEPICHSCQKEKAPNVATRKMLRWTIRFMDGTLDDPEDDPWTGEQLREYWMIDLREHPEDYDREQFPLIATPKIEKTIDYNWIAEQLPKHLTYDTD